MRVAFLHPDLGVGGAERLVVDAALGLQERGHSVHFYTYYHSPSHCFPETLDGRLPVTVWYSRIPHHIKRKGHVLLANLKMALLTLRFIFSGTAKQYDVMIVDQVAIPLVLLRAFSYPTFFYCHFPDKLCDASLAQAKRSLLRRAYRYIFDKLEEWCISQASLIAYNSQFTKETTLKTFPTLRQHPQHSDDSDDVIYPPVSDDLKIPAKPDPMVTVQTVDGVMDINLPEVLQSMVTLVSLNRFERKKNVELAIRTLAILRGQGRKDLQLIIAGGWHEKVPENVEYLEELKALTKQANLKSCVMFMPSVSAEVKKLLLQKASVFLYTPLSEHFGIVPVEAMLCGTPVVAVNNGGPKESIQHQVTGYLSEPNPLAFSEGVKYCLENVTELGTTGKRWAASTFGQREFARALEVRLQGLKEDPPLPSILMFAGFYFCILATLSFGIGAIIVFALHYRWWWTARFSIGLVPVLAIASGWLFMRSINVR